MFTSTRWERSSEKHQWERRESRQHSNYGSAMQRWRDHDEKFRETALQKEQHCMTIIEE
jgi:hypothetical protein